MLVAIPEVPETTPPPPPPPPPPQVVSSSAATTTTTTTTTTSSTSSSSSTTSAAPHNNNRLVKPCPLLLLKDAHTAHDDPPPTPECGAGVECEQMDMKPPVSATIPKSRNHRRTPPTPPPAHSPSPPALTPPPIMTSHTLATPPGLSDSASDKISSSHVMEINTTYAAPLVKKEVGSPPLGSPHLPPCSATDLSDMASEAVVPDSSFQQRILQAKHVGFSKAGGFMLPPCFPEQLKQQQQLQQQLLLHQYQQQQQQLAEQHEKQLQQHIKQQYLEQQSQRAEEERLEKQRRETERLEALKKKDKHEQSAVASSEVKQRLQEVILQKKQREAAATAGTTPGSSNLRNWPPGNVLGKIDDDFPLRKTASEPNICLKARHKQRMANERRPSPLVHRKGRHPGSLKRRPPYSTVESGSTPDSGQSSPPNGLPASRSSSGSTPIHEEGGGSPYGAHGGGGQGSCSDVTVYSSLPNISMGRPPHSTQPEGMKLPIVSEADMRAALPAHVAMPLTSHVLSSTLPYYPTLSVIDGERYSPGVSNMTRQPQVTAMETSSGGGIVRGGIYHPNAAPNISDAPVRPGRPLQRPLSRTHSSPLPLGHPVLQGQPPTFLPHGHPSAHQYDPKHAMDNHLLKQHIRQTVLTRSGSKNHVENVAEETEAAVAQAIATDKTPEEVEEESLHEEEPEVIDLTERKIEGSLMEQQQRERTLFLQNQRDLLTAKPPPLHSTTNSAFTPRSGSHVARPLSRAFSSPLVTLSPQGSPQEPININKQGATTGFAYDNVMLKHQCICGDNSHHPEHGGRLQSIMARLQETGLIHRCNKMRTRKATLEEIQSCHSEAHTLLFGTNPWNRQHLDMSKFAELPIKSFVRLHCGGVGVDSDTTWNDMHTSSAARMAAGCVIDLAFKVATGELRNGFALVRPPGHHAEHQQAMGFCFFNSIAIAARQLHQKLNLEKILIVDWDVHHGNGTQSMFYDDPHILYISMHRYDDGSFFPGTGSPTEVGEGDGYGFNVNIAYSGGLSPPMGDAEYMAAFRSIVMPIAKDFDPDIVLVSAGFDAADGHPSPLGGYKVSASCFGQMTKQLMTLARGKVVLALEGGYNLASICDATEACVRTLTSDEPPPLSEHEMTRPPCQNAIETLQNVIGVQSGHWPVVRRQSGMISLSVVEAQGREEEQETVSAMASLRVDPQNPQTQSPEPPSQSSANENTNDEEEPMEEDTEVK
ncbi:histone deacetylase 4 isoform X5 [Panulirus ornatus]|uniref:histone deacetylase 4 isoform X5 n=1 Tax=Panulirus ornatus TaxID=150431 RepID=UPI003A84AB07